MDKKPKLLFGGVFATHTEWDENGNVTERDEFHTRLYWDLWNSGAMLKLKGARLHVLLTIVQHCDKNGEGFPSVRRMSELLPYNKNAINTAINDLIELGFLEREQKRKEAGKFAHNNYKVKPILPCTENVDTVKTEENQVVDPCPKNTDTVKAGDRKTGNRKEGHKKDLSFKKESSLKKDIDDDAERISEKWELDFKYIAFREVFTKAEASDIKKHEEHYQKFLDASNAIGFGKLIQAAEECVQNEGKQAQIVLFLSGQYNQYIHSDKPASNKRKAKTTGKPVSYQEKVLERMMNQTKQEIAAGSEEMTEEELLQLRESGLKMLEEKRSSFSPVSGWK